MGDWQIRGLKRHVVCRCGHRMRVKDRHFGRMCRCTRCSFPIYVTYDNVHPPVTDEEREDYRFFLEQEVPLELEEGDVLMELYEVRGIIGRGGMGVVYLVYHREWGLELALKCPKPVGRASSRWAETFERECETWINLKPHPNIVQCYYLHRLGGFPRVFIEYVKGADLERLISDRRLYSGEPEQILERILDIAIQFAWGLGHAHAEGVIHQDVKPSNVLISGANEAKVTDFGLARVRSGVEEFLRSKRDGAPIRVGGTKVYCSPEHRTGDPVTEKSDIWCWAVSLMEMFAGEVFWRQGPLAAEALETVAERGSRFDFLPPIPPAVLQLLRRCLAASPSSRPKSMTSLCEEMVQAYQDLIGHAYGRETPNAAFLTKELMNNRAVSLADLGQYQNAETLWKDVGGDEDGLLEGTYNLDLLQWRTGRLTDGQIVARLEDKMEQRPGEWLPKYLTARVMIESGNCAQASSILERLDKSSKDEADDNRNIAFALAVAHSLVNNDLTLQWRYHVGAPIVSAIYISGDTRWIVSGDVNGRIRLWDTESGRCLRNVPAHEGRVFCITGSFQNELFLTGGADGIIKLWDPRTCECIAEMRGHTSVIRAMQLTRDATWLYSASRDGSIRVWDVATTRTLGQMRGHTASVGCIALSGDQRFLLSGSRDQTMRLWNARDGKCIHAYSPSHRPIRAVHLNTDGSQAISISGRKVKVWNTGTGAVLNVYNSHRTEIASLDVNESMGFGVTATQRSARIWHLPTGQCIRTVTGFAPAVLSSDGRYLATGGHKGEISLWSVRLGAPTFKAPFLLCRHAAEVAAHG